MAQPVASGSAALTVRTESLCAIHHGSWGTVGSRLLGGCLPRGRQRTVDASGGHLADDRWPHLARALRCQARVIGGYLLEGVALSNVLGIRWAAGLKAVGSRSPRQTGDGVNELALRGR